MRRISSCVVLLLFLCVSNVYATEVPYKKKYQNELQQLYKSIGKVQEHLKTTRYKRSNVLTDLQKLEREISLNSAALHKLKRKIKTLSSDIKHSREQIKNLEVRAQKQRSALREQIKAAYSLGTQQQLKILLNQQDPATLGQIQTYFDYLNKAHSDQIKQFLESIEDKRSLETKLARSLGDQKTALEDQKNRKNRLTAQRLKRSQLLAQIDREIENQEQNLSALESSRLRIENLLNSLGELLADIPASPRDTATFSSLKGKLPWPVDGPFISRFGSRKKGDLRWNGVLIGSPYGRPVRAVSHGRVAFSDWLQGFGFIIIINHDNGYMSLYGHNESLYKQVGDWVAAGDIIASTGDSGGQPVSGLYFEIRERGKPVNPAIWCSNNVSMKH